MDGVSDSALTQSSCVSLYVGDLDPAVSESQLFEKFSTAGPVVSVRVCRDSTTGKSLSYGYVNLQSRSDAIKAIQILNCSLLNGKAIRIDWSRRDPLARKKDVGNLFVKNLDETVDHNGLNEMFAKYGNILSSKVAIGDNGKSKGFGFVQFEREEDANNAMTNLNGATVAGKTLYVGNFIKKTERAVPNKEDCFRNVYVKNLDPEVVNEDVLREKFSEVGEITSCAIMKDDQGKSRGFGFICYASPEDAKKAINVMNGKRLGSKALYVGRAQKKHERENILQKEFEERRKQIFKFQGSNVYVKNLHDTVDEDQLKQHFSSCGNITSVKIMRDEKGSARGFGFVCFSSPEEAIKAVASFHSTMFHGKPLYVAIAQLKNVRQAQLHLLHSQCMSSLAPAAPVIESYSPIYLSYSQGVMGPQFSSPHPEAILHPYIGQGQGFRECMPLSISVNGQRKPKQQLKGKMNGCILPHVLQRVPCTPHWQLPVEQRIKSSRQFSKGKSDEKSKSMVKGGLSKIVSFSSPTVSSKTLNMLTTQLTALAPEKQKQIIGEHLFPSVHRLQHEFAGKITGMLLEMDNTELLRLLQSPDALAAKVEEAMEVLKLSEANLHSSGDVKDGDHACIEVAAK